MTGEELDIHRGQDGRRTYSAENSTGMAGYGSYYRAGSSQSGQHMYGFSATARSSSTHPDPSTYRNGDRQLEYGHDNYGWMGQNQQGYGNTHDQHYQSEAGRGLSSQSTGHDYRQSDRTTPLHQPRPMSNVASDHLNHTSSISNFQAPGNLGLNSLAYASGLESTGLNDSDSARTNSHNSASQPTGLRPTDSPAQKAPNWYSTNTQSYAVLHSPPSTSTQRLASSAAAALAGAVSRRQQSTQPTPAARLTSPAVEKPASRLSPDLSERSAICQAGMNSNRPFSVHSRPTHRSISSPSQPNTATLAARGLHTLQNSAQPQQPQESSTVVNGSIASLVNSDTNHSHQISRARTGQENIPAYIDPSQVFNPYHREHERRQREAAQVMAQERQRLVAEAEAEDRQRQVVEAEAEEKRRETAEAPASTASVPASDIPEKTPVTQPVPLQSSKTLAPVSPTGANRQSEVKIPDVESMATEMKNVMEKMRALKDKDPNLFQKLWDGMKQPVPADVARSAPSVLSTPVSTAASAPLVAPVSMSSFPTNPSHENGDKNKSKSHKATGGALSGSPGYSAPANCYQVVVEHNIQGLPDLGRFPAERRVRASYKKDRMDPPTKLVQLDGSSSQGPLQRTPNERSPNSVPQPLPSRSTSGTVWPEAKRNALAAAAVEALSEDAENQRIGIEAKDIHSLLEQNPSYLDLCTMLEARGLRFNRGRFARHLLRNVPDLTGHSVQQAHEAQAARAASGEPLSVAPGLPQPSATMGPVSKASPPSVQSTLLPHAQIGPPVYSVRPDLQPQRAFVYPLPHAQIGPPVYSVRPDLQPQRAFVYPLPHLHNPHADSQRRIPIKPVSHVISKLQASKPRQPPSLASPEPALGSKEAAARKRDFSELVDLTILSDSEDYVMPSKKARQEPPQGPEADPFAAYDRQLAAPAASAPSQAYQVLQNAGLSLLPNSMSRTGYAPSIDESAQEPAKKPRTLLAKQINKREALRKSYYDPKTVARDILIAAGRHTTERPLNAHLAGLLEQYVDMDSDLTTFDWEAVDPGGPPPPYVEPVDIPAGPPKWRLGEKRGTLYGSRGLDSSEPTVESVTQKRLDRGNGFAKNNDAKQGDAAGAALFSRFAAQSRQLLKDSSKSAKDPSQVPSRLRESHTACDPTEDQVAGPAAPTQRRASSRLSLTSPSLIRNNAETRIVSSSNATLVPAKIMEAPRRRGRPPGSGNKSATISHVKKAAQPVVAIPTAAPETQHFAIYKCRWRNCSSQLHNLSTLRKHVAKVHDKSTKGEGYICWWRKCRYLKRESDETYRPEMRFDSLSSWLDHIEEDHLYPIGLKYGDGPSSTPTGKHGPKFDLSRFRLGSPNRSSFSARTLSYLDPQTLARDRSRYLSDAENRTTTPSAVSAENSDVPADVMELAKATKDPEDLVAIKAYMKAHGNKKMDVRKSAEETLRAMEVRKEKIGPGLDRGGCTLVNESRRATLVQDADMARVIEFDFE